jgi:hypothetical protein
MRTNGLACRADCDDHPVPISLDASSGLEYQRSLIASMIAQLDNYQRLAPSNPESFQWAGEAQRRYGEQLTAFRDALWATRAELDEARFYLEAVRVPGP